MSASFPRHEHALGEEFLVLEGTADERGEYPAGTYVRNPPGSGHAPWADDGCVLFVKLRQFHPEDLERVAIDTRTAEWFPGIIRGIAVLPLHGFGSERVSLVRWAPHTRFVPHAHPEGEEIFVLDGAVEDEEGGYAAGSWLRNPPRQPARSLQPGGLPTVREDRPRVRRDDMTSARTGNGRRRAETGRAFWRGAGRPMKVASARTSRTIDKEDSMGKMNPVVHFEMPYDDRERMARFYRDAFGWQTQILGQETGNYVLATTTETGESGPTKPGAINGGFFPKRPDWPAQHPSAVIAVDDVQAAMTQVSEAGGEVLGEPMEIPGVGQYVSFFDTEGNRVSMLQPVPRNWHAPKPE